ncbi:MAG: glycosyltransferase family 4 protein [Patescibacteria group bacterium]
MNIGFFTDCYLPQIDGVVRSILLFRKSLESAGHQVFVFAPKEIKSEIKFLQKATTEEEKNVFRFSAINSFFIPGYPVAFPISLKTSYKIPKLNLDIIHSHSPIMIGMFGNLVALSENIPIISTYHTYYSEYAKHYWPIKKFKFATSKMVKNFEIFYYNRVDQVITPSEKLKKILQESGIENEITVLPTGIDLQEFKTGDGKRFRKKWGIGDDKKILLYVGRLNTEKNVDFLIEVANYLKNFPEIIFVFVGDGKSRARIEKKVGNLNLRDKVLFCEFLSRSETVDAFFACDVFVFSSKTDTQGLVLGEAVAAGKPVVMVKDEGLNEMVVDGKNGFEVEEKVPVFAEKVLKLLRQPDLYAEMAENSKEIATKFSCEKQTEKLEKLYKRVMTEYEATSWRRKMWKELNKEYKVRVWLKKIIE